ncbi:MAG: GIY-YIG nuclease family protein [Citromicrobium sp.]|nr:MAG: GIY-YIG nuclease family protein [Citromicrobium sp.]
MAFYTYLLRCNDGSYYAGHTEDLEVRLAAHGSGALGGYTSKRLPVTLMWSEEFPTRDEAFDAERRIKGWSRAKKEALIAGDWEKISLLAKNRQR